MQIGDAQSTVVAECGFNKGDCVISMGTGLIINVNIGDKPISSRNGLHPLAVMRYRENKIYMLHSIDYLCGIAVDWAKSIGNDSLYYKTVIL